MTPRAAYGVDLSPSRLVVVRASGSRRRPVLETVLSEAIGPEIDARSEMISLQAHAAAGSAVAAALPAARVFVRWLQTPFRSRRKAERVLPTVLDIQLPFPIESCACAFAEMNRNEEGNLRALALAARTEDVQDRLRSLQNAGVDPTIVDHEALALWSLAHGEETPAIPATYRTIMLLDWDRCTLVIGRGDTFQSAHPISTGESTEASAALSAILPRVVHLLRAQCPGPDATIAWLWAGSMAAEKAPREEAERSLGADGRISFRVAAEPETLLARALALRALAPGAARWNLRRGELEHAQAGRQRERGEIAAAVAGVAVGLLLILTNVGWQGLLKQKNAAMQVEVSALAAELTGLSPEAISRARGEETFVVRQHLSSGDQTGNPITRLFAPGASDALFRTAASAARHGLTMQEFTVKDGGFYARGTGVDWPACRAFQETLSGEGFNAVVEKEPETGSGDVGFSLRGGLRHGS